MIYNYDNILGVLYISVYIFTFFSPFVRGGRGEFSISKRERNILTSFIFRGAGAKNCPVVHRVVKKNSGALQDTSFESFSHDEGAIHIVIGQRENGSVVSRVGDHLMGRI